MAHGSVELRKPLCHDKAVIHEGDFLSSFIQRKSKLSLPFVIGVSCGVFLSFFFFLEWLINNVVSVLGVQQSDSVIHINIPILFFQVLFLFKLLQNIQQRSYTVLIQ